MALPVPCTHFPEDSLSGLERAAAIRNLDGSVRFNLSGIPDISVAGSESIFCTCSNNLVGSLNLPSSWPEKFPAQSWMCDTKTNGIGFIFAAEGCSSQVSFGSLAGAESQYGGQKWPAHFFHHCGKSLLKSYSKMMQLNIINFAL